MGICKRWIKYTPMYLLGMFVVRVISSLFFAGFLSKILAEKLAKTGALSSYALGQEEIDE